MVHIETIYIETKRLILKPYHNTDASAVYKVINRKAVYDMTSAIPHPYPRESIEPWIDFTRKNIVYGCSYELGAFDKEAGNYLGNIGVVGISKRDNNAELAYFIDPNHWGMGYATEAVKGILEFGFNELKLERIVGRCMACNLASKRVMEKNGLLLEGLARHEIKKDGKYIDVFRLAILSTDYKER